MGRTGQLRATSAGGFRRWSYVHGHASALDVAAVGIVSAERQ